VTQSPTSAAERYRQTVGEMADLVGERGHHDNPRRWGRLTGEWLAERRELVATEEGRTAIAGFLTDPRPAVRLWSAAAALFWDPDAARPVLAEIRDSPMTYDLHSIAAKHTLLDFDAGTFGDDDLLPGT
jgi:hypothetical protein